MKRYLRYALAATTLSFSLIGVASAQTASNSADSMAGMHDANGMHNMQGGGMMSMMMGDDPVAACSSRMKKIAANPKLHQQMNAMMHSQMGAAHGVTSPSTNSKLNQ